MKPFLKWAGNKYRIINRIQEVLPEGRRLIEPFVGSGAVFLNANYKRYLLGEQNPDLVNLYRHIQKEGIDFIKYAKNFFKPNNNTENKYYEFRDLFNQSKDTRLKAALFIYFNKAGYNGLCRYNSKGIFNVPYGHRDTIYFPAAELQEFHKKAKKAHFIQADFPKTLKQAKPGDVVYCDPPYVPLTKTANFTNYHRHGFTEEQQLSLAKQAEDLANKGIPVILSNHDTPFVRKIYKHATDLIAFEVERSISRDWQTRGKVPEVLILFMP